MKYYEEKKKHNGKKDWPEQLVLNKIEAVG